MNYLFANLVVALLSEAGHREKVIVRIIYDILLIESHTNVCFLEH